MRIRPGILITIVVMFAVLFGSRYLGWFGKRPAEVSSNETIPPPPAPEITETPPTDPASRATPNVPQVARANPAVKGVRTPVTPAPTTEGTAPTAIIGEWEQRIDD